ncbi:MAG TPA: hypothetical protein VFW62_03640, partial [bacterium]|nr:hypothetical protein [bacterium]
IPLAYLILTLFLGFVLERPDTRSGKNLAWRWFNLAAAVAVCLGICYLFWREAAGVFQILSQTAYPGARKIAGGGWEAWKLFSNYLLPFRDIKDWGPLANICEASFFYYFFPLLGLGCLLSYHRFRANALIWALLAYIGALCLWMMVGFPESLASALLFNRVLEHRAGLALGLADMALTALYLSRPSEYRSKWMKILAPTLLLLGWATFLAWTGLKLKQNFGSIPVLKLLLAGIGFLAIGAALVLRRKVGLVILLAISVLTTYWFNPVTQGGTQFLRGNPLSLKILELNREIPGGSTWVSFNESGLSNLFRMLGVRALSGVHFYPQFALWEKLDPKGESRDVYNRYAHVSFILGDDKTAHRIDNPSPDTVHLQIHPEDPAFAKLGVDYIVFTGPRTELLDRSPRLRYLWSYGDKHLYRFIPSQGIVPDQQDESSHP